MTTIAHPSVMIRRTALSLVGGYGESYRTAQDLDLFLKLAEHGRLANIEEPLIKYRWHAENVSIRNAEQQDKDVTAILQSALSRRNLPPLRRIPPIRLQFRRRLALQCAQAGHRGAAIQLAWGACRLRPHSIGNWLTLVGVAACPWALERMMRWRHQLKQ